MAIDAGVQKEWNQALEGFVQAYPKAEDAPDALRQLAINCEFGGKAEQDKAKKYYGLIASNFPGHPLAPHANGALKRLEPQRPTIGTDRPNPAGRQFTSAKFKGKVTVVYYWASMPKTPW